MEAYSIPNSNRYDSNSEIPRRYGKLAGLAIFKPIKSKRESKKNGEFLASYEQKWTAEEHR